MDDFIKVSENGKRLSEEIHVCFNELKEFLDGDPYMEERTDQKPISDGKLKDLADRFSEF